MREYFTEPKCFGTKVKVELDLYNYATKAELKNATGECSKKMMSLKKLYIMLRSKTLKIKYLVLLT